MGKVLLLPFCPEHGLRIHKNTFAYYNGNPKEAKILSLKRNLIFNSDYYIKNILRENTSKAETEMIDHESSDETLIWNVFSELSLLGELLEELVAILTRQYYDEPINLYLWGRKFDLRKNLTPQQYKPLLEVRKLLEHDIKRFVTEPDIMLVVPKKLVLCIEAKFGSENPAAEGTKQIRGERPKKISEIIKKYYLHNELIKNEVMFDLRHIPKPFYEELFRNIIFAASMAKIEGNAQWYVVNLRSQHIIYLNRSLPVQRNIRAFLMPKFRKQFIHFTWENIYAKIIKGNPALVNLAWYLKNKTLNCRRAFNIIH